MRRFLSLFIPILTILFLNGCQEAEQSSLKLNGENNNTSTHLEVNYHVVPFDDLVADADLIAHVKIEEKLGEKAYPTPKSIFLLSIMDVFKYPENLNGMFITVVQDGTDRTPIMDAPFIFIENEEYILFLREIPDSNDAEYLVLNGPYGVYRIDDKDRFVTIDEKVYTKDGFISYIEEKLSN